jgi:dethiobiotin synthetase
MRKIFVTATNTDIGKTYSSKKLLEEFASQGYRVGYFKPFESGVDTFPLDGKLLFDVVKSLNSDFDLTLDDVVPYQFKLPASIYVAKESLEIDYEFLKDKIKEFDRCCDILIIEGAGGLMVPIDSRYFLIDLIKIFDIDKTLLITSSKLGSINDTLLSMEALNSRDIDFEWSINLYLDRESFPSITMPYYRDRFGKNLNILQYQLKELVYKLLKDKKDV